MSGDVTCAALSARKVANPVNTPTVSTSPCENLITSSTPKNSVKPTATRAYITPSINPLIRYCSPISMVPPSWPALSLLQLALAGAVFAVLPDHPLAVLRDVLGDQRHGVLAVVVERHRA